MQKKFIENLLFLVIINLLVKPFWIFGIDRAVQVTAGDLEYGFYFSLFNFSFIFQMILDFGITNFNNRNIARHPQLLPKFFSSILSFKLLLTVIYFIVLFITGYLIGYSARAVKLLSFLALNQVLLSYILYLRSNISAIQHFKLDGLFSVMDRLIMIILCSIVLWGKVIDIPFRIEYFVYIQTISYLLTAITVFITVYRKAGYFRFNFDRKFFIVIAKNTWPFALLSLLMSVYTRIDGVMIERLLPGNTGKTEAGIYAQGYRVLDAANMFAFLFATLLLPIFSRMLKNRESIVEMARTSYSLFIFPAFILVTACFLYRREIMELLYHQGSSYNFNIFGWLMINFLAIGSVYVFGTLLTANGNLKFLNWLSFSGVILNICLNFLLIRNYQAFGAVIATLVTQFLMSIFQVAKAVKIFRIIPEWKYLVKSTCFFILVPAVFYIFKNYIPGWISGFFAAIIAGFVLILIFRLIGFRKMISELNFNQLYHVDKNK